MFVLSVKPQLDGEWSSLVLFLASSSFFAKSEARVFITLFFIEVRVLITLFFIKKMVHPTKIDCPRLTIESGVVVITTAQLHSTKPELRFCAGSNLLAACRRFVMVRISDNGPGWK